MDLPENRILENDWETFRIALYRDVAEYVELAIDTRMKRLAKNGTLSPHTMVDPKTTVVSIGNVVEFTNPNFTESPGEQRRNHLSRSSKRTSVVTPVKNDPDKYGNIRFHLNR